MIITESEQRIIADSYNEKQKQLIDILSKRLSLLLTSRILYAKSYQGFLYQANIHSVCVNPLPCFAITVGYGVGDANLQDVAWLISDLHNIELRLINARNNIFMLPEKREIKIVISSIENKFAATRFKYIDGDQLDSTYSFDKDTVKFSSFRIDEDFNDNYFQLVYQE